jgi:uncharacterized protein YegL
MSMRTSSGATRIEELNRGLKALEDDLRSDPTAMTRVQLAIVCVGGPAGEADVMMDWTDAKDFQAFELTHGGLTYLGKGLELALEMVEHQKQVYRAHGVPYTRPWVMVITDGEPTDEPQDWAKVVAACRAAEGARKCTIYPIGVGGANLKVLQEVSRTPALVLDQVKFVELFQWLSSSLTTASRSAQGDTVQLAPTNPWVAVKL